MMGMDTGFMLVAVLVCALALPAFLVGAFYVGSRALGGSRRGERLDRGEGLDSARATLNERLAAGEVELEDYYERESALRSAEPPAGKRRSFS